MEHTWDGDLLDLNNPLAALVSGLIYGTQNLRMAKCCVAGLGNFAGGMSYLHRRVRGRGEVRRSQVPAVYARS